MFWTLILWWRGKRGTMGGGGGELLQQIIYLFLDEI